MPSKKNLERSIHEDQEGGYPLRRGMCFSRSALALLNGKVDGDLLAE